MFYRPILAVIVFSLASQLLIAQPTLDRARALVSSGDVPAAAAVVKQIVGKEPKNVDALVLASQIYTELESADTALQYAKRAYDESDTRGDVVRQYALALSKSGSAEQATVIMRKFVKKNESVENYLALVDALIEADSLRAAELVGTMAKSKFSKSAQSFLALGNIYFNFKPQPVFELAKQNYEEAIKLEPTLIQAHFNLAQSYWKLANAESDDELSSELFKRCLLSWNEVGKLDPTNARAFFEQGKIFYLAKRYRDATKALIEYRKLRPVGTGLAIASWYLGNSFYELNECDSARIHLQDAGKQIDTLRNKTSLLLARCAFRTKQWSNASRDFGTANAAGIMEPLDFWYYGTSQVLAGDTTSAITTMWKASEVMPQQCVLMFRFGLLLQGRDTKGSTTIFRKRLAACSDSLDARILVFIGNNFFQDSVVDSADAYYDQALAKEPNNCYFITRKAEILLARDDMKGARAMLDDVVARCGTSESAQDKRYAEQALVKLCNLDLQEKAYVALVAHAKSIVTNINPSSSIGWLYLGIGHQGAGVKDEACKAYKKALEYDPNSKPAKDNLKSLGC
jgi:tetratricopeptide (TPR) repeat protein